MPLENECLHHMLLNSGNKANSSHCKYNSIIENFNRGTSCLKIDGAVLTDQLGTLIRLKRIYNF
jgi:hypothetical protein